MQPSASGASPGSRTRRRARRCSCWTPTSSTRPAGRSRIRIRPCSNRSSRRRCSGSGSRRSSSTTCWSSGAFRSPGWGCTGSRGVWAARRPPRWLVRPSTRSRRIASSITFTSSCCGARGSRGRWPRCTRWCATPGWKAGVRLGLLVTLQMAASMYYGLFLVVTLAVFAPVLLATEYTGGRAGLVRLIRSAAIAAAIAGAVGAGYRVAFSQAVGQLGVRSLDEVTAYSAWPSSYLAAPGMNRLYGHVTSGFYRPELALFPGAAALVLLVVGLWPPLNRTRLAYLPLLAFSAAASMGVHTFVYRLLHLLPPFQNVRVPGRFAAIALAAVAVLAASGASRVLVGDPAAACARGGGRPADRGAGDGVRVGAAADGGGTTIAAGLHRAAPAAGRPGGGVSDADVQRAARAGSLLSGTGRSFTGFRCSTATAATTPRGMSGCSTTCGGRRGSSGCGVWIGSARATRSSICLPRRIRRRSRCSRSSSSELSGCRLVPITAWTISCRCSSGRR